MLILEKERDIFSLGYHHTQGERKEQEKMAGHKNRGGCPFNPTVPEPPLLLMPKSPSS
jgi:hypothetical protein